MSRFGVYSEWGSWATEDRLGYWVQGGDGYGFWGIWGGWGILRYMGGLGYGDMAALYLEIPCKHNLECQHALLFLEQSLP